MKQLSFNELTDIIERRHHEIIKYAFIIKNKIYEAHLEEVSKSNFELLLTFLKGDLKIVLDANTIVLNHFKNQYEILTNGKYIGSLFLDIETCRQ